MNLRQQTIQKAKELGSQAEAYFGVKQSTIDKWSKKPTLIPMKAIEKVLEDSNQIGVTKVIDAPVYSQPIVQGGPQLVPPRPPVETVQPSAVPPSEASPTPFQTIAPQPQVMSYTLETARNDIREILAYFNTTVFPHIESIKNKVMEHERKFAELFQPAPVSAAPTVGQMLATDPNRLQPSHVNPSAVSATTLQTFGGHPLDTGVAPTLDQIRQQEQLRATGGVPDGPAHTPAGPARPMDEQAAAVGPKWLKPAPQTTTAR